ncbi:MAG: porin [Methylophaga sp.]|uniref:porin n=1 Tax=unclassified Methylophaga TaxID=2629249 RepID=UPI000C61CBAB|nr:porin [Methylophaga sp. UBA678]MAX51942.1 porin [Methylophaga sp.]|tara:strand:+ start:56516 stop:57715 length:1200 start_codon:yes stop_codon:yes gene_type:complete
MKLLKKSTLASLVGAAALTAAGAANATIVVGGENGYEFSVDGNINQFFIASDQDSANGGFDQNNQQVANGLLPTFFGFNVAMPEINGLKVAARVSISPSTNNGSYFNENQGGNDAMEQREAFATVDGSFGQIMLGKGLGLYAANNILLDQTLYGVGATGVTAAGDQNTGTTSLGRIGWGYEYANWRSQIRYTTPDMNGFKAAIAVADSDDFLQATGTGFEKDARYEASLSYATAFDGGSMKLWLDGMTQDVRYSNATGSETSDAYTVGGQLIFGGFEAVATYYDSKGQGVNGLGTGAFNTNGSARDGDGYYAQLGYRFGGQTFVAASYGESTLDRDNTNASLGDAADLDTNSMATIGIYHDVTANLKLVAEYSQMETEYHNQSSDDEVDVLSVGGFISW